MVINGIKCRALLDTGAGSTYISQKLIELLKKKPAKTECRQIDMMSTLKRKVEVYGVQVKYLKGDFQLDVDARKVEKEVLISLKNPKYKEILKRFPHLKGEEIEIEKLFFTKSSIVDCEKLCSLNVLGLKYSDDGKQNSVFEEFKDQLERKPEGFYEKGLIWKSDKTELTSTKPGGLTRLGKLVQKLEKDQELFSAYDKIMKDQESGGIIEEVNCEGNGKVFYLPHKPVIRQNAESRKIGIVYDEAAREKSEARWLNEFLETGPPLQNMIWDIITRNRLRTIPVAGDLKQAFLQIRIRESDRDALRFHWLKDKDKDNIGTYRFTRLIFGLNQSPFLLGGTIEHHLSNEEKTNMKAVEEIHKSIYVDDVSLSGNTHKYVKILKGKTIEIFERAGFQLHKWHSNEIELEKDQKKRTALV